MSSDGRKIPGSKYSIERAIGNTPLLELTTLSPRPNKVQIIGKLELMNPSGSIKDRIAEQLLLQAEQSGKLSPGQAILEPTSGNTGISLAMLCARRQIPMTAVIPENATPERRQLLEIYGVEIITSPGELGSNGAVALAQELAAADPRYFMPYQYGNQANPDAHYQGTGAEILADCPEVSALVAGLGTGGTLVGAGRRLKEANPEIIVAAAEPAPGEQVQGLRSLQQGFIPPVLDLQFIDRKILVSNQQAVLWTRRLLQQEGIFAGVSAGANLHVAQILAQEMEQGAIVVIIPDDGWRYLSTGIYQPGDFNLQQVSAESWW